MKNLYTIIWPFCIFSPEDKIKNTNFKGKYNELKNLLFYWIDQWNNIIYAFNKTKDLSSDFDPRFYYQSILFNLYMLWSICQRIEADILGDGDNLKNLRDNIAHMDEKLKKPLNTVLINDVYKDAIIKENWVTNIGVSLVGLQIDLNTWIVAYRTKYGTIRNFEIIKQKYIKSLEGNLWAFCLIKNCLQWPFVLLNMMSTYLLWRR